jgi:hypothetical protein
MQRTASRSTAFALTAAVGLTANVITLIVLAIDNITGNSIAAHVTAMYRPYGTIPDLTLPWIVLYVTFAAASACCGFALWGSVHQARWTRPFSTVVFLIGGSLLVFLFMVSEHGAAILPTGWRVVCLSMAIYSLVAMLIAWLPTTDRIRE